MGSCCEKQEAQTYYTFHLATSFLEFLFLLSVFQNLTIMNVMTVILIKSAAIYNVIVIIAQDDLFSVCNNALNRRFKIIAVMFSLIFQYKGK